MKTEQFDEIFSQFGMDSYSILQGLNEFDHTTITLTDEQKIDIQTFIDDLTTYVGTLQGLLK